jgi:hypothetical protein
VKPSRSTAATFLSAVLFAAIAAVSGSGSAAADTPPGVAGNRATTPDARSVVIEHRTLPQVAPGGTVVLRGSRSSETTLPQLTPGAISQGYGSSTVPGQFIAPGAGGDTGLEGSGPIPQRR